MVGRANGESPRAGVGGATGYEYPCKWRLAASVGTSRTHFSLSLVLGGKRVRAGLPRAQSSAKRRKRGCFFFHYEIPSEPAVLCDRECVHHLRSLFLSLPVAPVPSLSLFSLPRLLLILRPIHRPLPSSSSSSSSLSLFVPFARSLARRRQRRVPRARSLVFPPWFGARSWLSSWCVLVNAQWRRSSNSRADNMEEGAVVLR